MTEEEYFRKNYPDACYGDKLLSPYWDYFQDGVEFGERQSKEKITKLERKIASIRGSHRVDLAKLKARIEQVERLKKENAELRMKLNVANIAKSNVTDIVFNKNDQLTKAKEIIRELLDSCFGYNSKTVNYEVKTKAEQFLKEE